MKFSLFTLGFALTALAAPHSKRAVFSTTSYNDLSISGGVAGNAQQEALAKLSGLPSDLSTVEKADLDFLNSVNSIANDAEDEAFNPAIDAASGDEAVSLQAQQAQGEDVADKLEAENKKLQNNISQDEEAAGQASTFLSFDATTD
ncbi:small secreted protein [Ilyonectria robusta]